MALIGVAFVEIIEKLDFWDVVQRLPLLAVVLFLI